MICLPLHAYAKTSKLDAALASRTVLLFQLRVNMGGMPRRDGAGMRMRSRPRNRAGRCQVPASPFSVSARWGAGEAGFRRIAYGVPRGRVLGASSHPVPRRFVDPSTPPPLCSHEWRSSSAMSGWHWRRRWQGAIRHFRASHPRPSGQGNRPATVERAGRGAGGGDRVTAWTLGLG